MSGMGWGALAQFGTDLMNVGHSAIQNEKNRRHQEYYWRNAIQMRKEDLVAAGLNPILAATGGGMQPGGGGAPGGQIGGSARGGYAQHERTYKLAESERDLLDSQSALAMQKKETETALSEKARQEAIVTKNSAMASELDPLIRLANLTSAEEAALISAAQRKVAQAEVPRALLKEEVLGDLSEEAVGMWRKAHRFLTRDSRIHSARPTLSEKRRLLHKKVLEGHRQRTKK